MFEKRVSRRRALALLRGESRQVPTQLKMGTLSNAVLQTLLDFAREGVGGLRICCSHYSCDVYRNQTKLSYEVVTLQQKLHVVGLKSLAFSSDAQQANHYTLKNNVSLYQN